MRVAAPRRRPAANELSRRRRELVLVAVAVDRHALHLLHGEVRHAVGRDAALDEPRDPWMLEQREDAALLEEAADEPRRCPVPDDLSAARCSNWPSARSAR